jgi:hypothetical protein
MTVLSCPSCGVAVTTGYVRCPKCKRPLPRIRLRTGMEGGTVMPSAQRRWWPYAVAVVAGLLVAIFVIVPAVRSKKATPAEPAPPPVTAQPEPGAAPAPNAATPAPPPTAAPTGPSPQLLANELDRTLKRKHLWSTVEIVGDHVDVRSSSCRDKELPPVVDGALGGFKAAGMSRLRCLEQNGTVVFQRDL